MLCDDLGGWDSGEWGGREGFTPEGGVNIELVHFIVQRRLTQYCKTTIPLFE